MRAQPSSDEARELVEKYGLKRAGARPSITQYTRELWGRRHFIVEFSRARSAVGYSRSFLGQAWQVLTPLLNAAVYYFIFGLLLGTDRGVHNFIAFLVIGVFTFRFIQESAIMGARSISGNLGLTRVLHFPRAVLPVSATLVALQALVVSLVVLIPIVLVTGEPLSVDWFLMIPAIALESLFCVGLAMILARVGSKVPDTSQVLPFVLRTWMYTSGVMYSITAFTQHSSGWVRDVLTVNPGAVYIELMRNALLSQHPSLSPYLWYYAVGWAIVVAVAGYAFFWVAEEKYGRV